MLRFSASKALGSPRSAFCASKGTRSMTRTICSLGVATGGALRDSIVSRAAPARHATIRARSSGNNCGLGAVSRMVIQPVRNSTGCLEEALALHQALQTQHRPHLAPTAKRARKIHIATNDRRRRLRSELRLGEAPESQNFVDDQSRRNLSMIHHDHARVPARAGGTAPQELP